MFNFSGLEQQVTIVDEQLKSQQNQLHVLNSYKVNFTFFLLTKNLSSNRSDVQQLHNSVSLDTAQGIIA